jgi:N-acetyl-anhydromuramyl-L-alanine amidase AmpD
MNITNIIKELPYNKKVAKWNKRALHKINKIVVHQELGVGTLEGVNAYHITPAEDNHLSKSGAFHICYHFGIRDNGEVCQMNNLDDITWHVKGYNTTSVGIMLQGDFNAKEIKYVGKNRKPTEAQLKSLSLLLDFLVKLLKLSKQEVFGHKELQLKPVCPGDDILDIVQKFREQNEKNIAKVSEKNS